MDINWIQILVGAVAGLLTALGGGSIFYVKITRKDKQLDVELKEADAWKALYEEQKAKCDEKSEKIRALFEKIDAQKKAEARHLAIIQQLKWYRCTRNMDECSNRQPPRDYSSDVEQLENDLLAIAKSNTN